MANTINQLSSNRPIIDENGFQTKEFRLWINQVTNNGLIVGNGSPNGVIEASQGAEYADLSGTTGSIKYIKLQADVAGDKTQGWVLI